MVNRLPVALLTSTFVVFKMGKVLQQLVLHGKLPGVSFKRDFKVESTNKSLRYFRRQKVIIGSKVKIEFRHFKLCRMIWWHLVVRARKFLLGWYVTTSRIKFSFLPLLPHNKLSSLGSLIAWWISMSSNCSQYPCFIRYCFYSQDLVTRLSRSDWFCEVSGLD